MMDSVSSNVGSAGSLIDHWMLREPHVRRGVLLDSTLESSAAQRLFSNLAAPVAAACYVNELEDGQLKDKFHYGFALPDVSCAAAIYEHHKRKKEKITVFLYNLQHKHDFLCALRRQLQIPCEWRQYDIGATISVPLSTIGFHADDKDVVIGQIAGRRRWRIWAPSCLTQEFRAELMLQGSRMPTRPERPTSAPLIDVELACGDTLYIPALYPHEGVSLQEDGRDSVSISYSWVALCPGTFVSSPQTPPPVDLVARAGAVLDLTYKLIPDPPKGSDIRQYLVDYMACYFDLLGTPEIGVQANAESMVDSVLASLRKFNESPHPTAHL